jgi:protoporphyrinogen oxidase
MGATEQQLAPTDGADPVRDMQVAILGAGPAGLAAGHFLTSRDVPVYVLELHDYVGGLCRTEEVNGFKFDLGGHRWFTKNKELHQWFLKLMEGELVTVQRTSRIYFDGKYYEYPISIKNVLQNAGLFTSVYAVLSYFRAAIHDLFSDKEPVNLREAFVSQFGEKLFDMFFRRYTEKVWGCPCDEISADWVSQRSKGLSILTTIKDAIIKSRNVVSLVDEFVYPREGYQRICKRMAEDMENGSGTVHLSSPVKRIVYHGPHDFTLTYETPDGEREQHATDVISTIPANHLVRMLEPKCPQAVTDAAKSLRFRDLITATVMLKKEQVTTDTWLYVHDEDLLFARLHEPKNWSTAMVPGPEYTSVVCECFCSRGDEIWELSDDQIRERVVADLADRLGFIERSEVLDVCIIRTVFAYPVYDLDYHAKVKEIYGFVNEHEGLHLVGRGGTFRYNNADHSIEMGQLLAKRLLGEDLDHMSVNTAKEYHEEIRTVLHKLPEEDSSKADSADDTSASAG